MCNKLNIAACLKPIVPGEPSLPNEGDKAALLDFYNKMKLLNPSTGEKIYKVATCLNLCGSSDVSINQSLHDSRNQNIISILRT